MIRILFFLFTFIFQHNIHGYSEKTVSPTFNGDEQKSRTVFSEANKSDTGIFKCVVQPFYRYRPDGKPGREITVKLMDTTISGKGTIELDCAGEKQIIPITVNEKIKQFSILLPAGAGVKSGCTAKIILRIAGHEYANSVSVPAKRQWTVYIYPHSHVDIGYTNTQANVQLIHKRNLFEAIKLAKKTAAYPKDARYLWNPEVLWPVERCLKTATAKEKQEIIEAVQKGYLHLDAGYVNMNTSVANDTELVKYFSYSRRMEKLTGKKIETFVQVDVPGMAWAIVPVAAKFGIKYCFALNNGIGRVGHSTDLSFKPFWWLGPDGKSKILFLQPGSYRPGAEAKGHDYWPKMAGQTDTSKLLKVVRTDHPRENFVDSYLAKQLPELEKSGYYPYNIFAMSWAMADNTPIDADLPDAVKSWNEDYAFPHLVIASATQIMKAFEKKYGNQLPSLKGDFTEYWTDGLGTAAKQVSMNRSSKERLVQAQALWKMLRPEDPMPQQKFQEAWRNVIMGDEHTWCFMDPSKQPITNDILKVKFGFFQKASDISHSLTDSALSVVYKKESSVIAVFNTLSWPHGGLVTVPEYQSKMFGKVFDEQGKPVVCQRLSSGELVFYADDIPAFSSKKYFLKKGKTKTKGTLAHDNVLDNGIIKATIDSVSGDISSLIAGGNVFVGSKGNCALNSYRYLYGDNNPSTALGAKDVKIIIKENGPVMATIEVASNAEGCNSLSRKISIIAGVPYLEISDLVDKKAVLKKEGVHFGFAFNIPEPKTRVDIPWGVMQLEKDQLSGANRNWIAFQRWIDISNNKKGVTWCSLDAPVFESGNITANITGPATNSPQWIKKLEPGSTIYSWVMNNYWYTNFPLSQEGKVTFRYRIFPHNYSYNADEAAKFGKEQSQPFIIAPIK
jgi:hypothetical protein